MKLTYLGHSAFEIETNGSKILIDPFLIMVPNYNVSGVTDIFVTHAHSDHLGNAIEISGKAGAVITAVFELANYCSKKGANSKGINLGGFINYSWGRVQAVPAFHSSMTSDGVYGGCPCGYIFDIEGKRIYHAGDTCLNSEMKVIGEVHKPEIAMLPIGGYYTMDIDSSVKAAEWLNCDVVIPMHYDTFDLIKADINEFEQKISGMGKTPKPLKIGQPLDF